MTRMVRTTLVSAGTLRRSVGDGENRWRDLLGPLLDHHDVQRRLGLDAAEDIGDLVDSNRLLAVPTDEGDELYPEFQFEPGGNINPTIGRVLAILGPVVVTHYTIASWLRSPREDLGGRAPVEW